MSTDTSSRYTVEELAELEQRGRRLYSMFEKIIDYAGDVCIYVERPSGERELVERLTSFDELDAWSRRREKVGSIRDMY